MFASACLLIMQKRLDRLAPGNGGISVGQEPIKVWCGSRIFFFHFLKHCEIRNNRWILLTVKIFMFNLVQIQLEIQI